MELTAKQKAFIDTYMLNPVESMGNVAKSMGIAPNTIYTWKCCNTNGFRDALEEALARQWEEAKYMAANGMFGLAREGDYKALKYILDYHGYEPSKKIEANVNGDINICIDVDEG